MLEKSEKTMKEKITNFIICILILFSLVLGIYNSCANTSDFFNASATQILTLLITIGIGFWITQYRNDQRKAKEQVESIVTKLQQIVTNERFYIISCEGDVDETKKYLNTTNRKINNYINILTEYSKMLSFSQEISYIGEEFNKYRNTIGYHIHDLEYLSKTEQDFKLISENIDTKCEYIILSLYKC